MNDAFDPQRIAVLQRALTMALAVAGRCSPVAEAVRDRMAQAIITAAEAGFEDPEKLAGIAVDAAKIFEAREMQPSTHSPRTTSAAVS